MRKKRPKNSPPTKRKSWRSALRLPSRRTLGFVALIMVVAGASFGVWTGLHRLDAHVDRLLLSDRPDPVVEFIDLPKELHGLANVDLHQSLFDVIGRDWVDDQICGDIAAKLTAVAWVARVNHVRRTGGGRFEISCRYRMPAALVVIGDNGFLVDDQAVRLPGLFVAHPTWRTIRGVAKPAPLPGVRWEGDDVRAALAVLQTVAVEPFAAQIVGVSVENFGGRRDPRGTHMELLTDRPGGRIHWGSAPGSELEENGVPQKLALLRENFRVTGRADAQHAVIDVSVYPDRYTIPG